MNFILDKPDEVLHKCIPKTKPGYLQVFFCCNVSVIMLETVHQVYFPKNRQLDLSYILFAKYQKISTATT